MTDFTINLMFKLNFLLCKKNVFKIIYNYKKLKNLIFNNYNLIPHKIKILLIIRP